MEMHSSSQVIFTKEVLSVGANRYSLTQHLHTSFSSKFLSMAVVRVGHICRIFPGAFTPTAAWEGGVALSQNIPEPGRPALPSLIQWGIPRRSDKLWDALSLLAGHGNYFCTPSQCPPWLGCYLSASQKPFWAGWCCWDLIHWLILNQSLCSFTTVLRTIAFQSLRK